MESDLRRTSISLPDKVFEQGQLIAKLRRRSFSNYVADLIASDIEAAKSHGDRSGLEEAHKERSSLKKTDHK